MLISNIMLTKSSDMLNKNRLAVKKSEANQKQHCSYSYKRPKSLISGKAKNLNDIQQFTAGHFHNYDWVCHLATFFVLSPL